MRIEIVEECEHGGMSPHLVGDVLFGVDLPECLGGSRREATEAELLSLVADLLTEKGARLVMEYSCEHGWFRKHVTEYDPAGDTWCDRPPDQVVGVLVDGAQLDNADNAD